MRKSDEVLGPAMGEMHKDGPFCTSPILCFLFTVSSFCHKAQDDTVKRKHVYQEAYRARMIS